MNVVESLGAIASEAFGESVDSDVELRDLGGWDSMNHMRFIMLIEEEFEVVLEGDDIVEVSTLRRAQEILSKYGIQ